MNGYHAGDAKQFILSKMHPEVSRLFPEELSGIIEALIQFDLQFMAFTHVIDENGDSGSGEYDEDDAFEYLLDAYLDAHPCDEDQALKVAAVIDQYMEHQYAFLRHSGLVWTQE